MCASPGLLAAERQQAFVAAERRQSLATAEGRGFQFPASLSRGPALCKQSHGLSAVATILTPLRGYKQP